MEKENRLTEGNVLRVLLTFSIPYLIANIIQALYGAVDLMIIGKYCDKESVAAVSTGTQVTQIITSMISGLTLGGTILVGKYIGMGKKEEAKETIGTVLSIFGILSIVLTVGMLFLVNPILAALETPKESFVFAKQYVVICSCGIFFICGYNAVSAVLRGYGDSKRPMLFIALACFLNIAGDFLLVKYLNLGVRGVALATILSQGISMICAVLFLNHSNFLFTFSFKNFKIKKKRALELAKVGIPISLQECMVRISFLYLTSITNRLGVSTAAAVGIASKYDVFAMLPSTSISSALSAITAQNYGAGKKERANISLIAGTIFAFCVSFIFFLWARISPDTMIGIFSDNKEVIAAGIPFFRSCSFDYLIVSFVFCMNGYLNGCSKTIFTMISCCFGALFLRMPLIYLAYRFYPENLTIIGSIAPLVSGIMAVYTIVYLRKVWKKQK